MFHRPLNRLHTKNAQINSVQQVLKSVFNLEKKDLSQKNTKKKLEEKQLRKLQKCIITLVIQLFKVQGHPCILIIFWSGLTSDKNRSALGLFQSVLPTKYLLLPFLWNLSDYSSTSPGVLHIKFLTRGSQVFHRKCHFDFTFLPRRKSTKVGKNYCSSPKAWKNPTGPGCVFFREIFWTYLKHACLLISNSLGFCPKTRMK